jgi:hypothetical protein
MADNPQATPSESDFFAAFGVTDPNATPPETDPPAQTDPKPNTDPAPQDTPPADTTTQTGETPPAEPDQQEPNPQPQNQQQTNPDTKSAHAFAQMRTQNSQYQKTIQGIAHLLNINSNNPEEILQGVNAALVQAQAKQQGIPTEVLQRLQTLEQMNQQREQEQLEQNVFTGFQQLKDKYKLTDDALTNFAAELHTAGVNPFEHPTDIIDEYRKRHFDDLITQAIEQGRQQEIARATSAQQHSASVQNSNGTPPAEPEKINTVADLTKYLNNIK